MPPSAHQTVLLNEAVDALSLKPNGVYIDGTFGRGGHGLLILSRLGESGKLIVFDRDPEAIAAAEELLGDDPRVVIIHAPFSSMKEELDELGLYGDVDGIVLDLGVSSPQIDVAERGFSFQKDGPLDMRMDTTQGLTAAQWLAEVEENELIRVLKRYGEERFAKRITTAIKAVLLETPIETTLQLSRIVDDAVPFKEKDKHPATRSFQAIRIAVNAELQELETVLPVAFEALALEGRLAIISFHSLEDRMVKNYFRDEAKGDPYPIDLPIQADLIKPKLKLIGKPVRASKEEVRANRRSRSAIMRIAQRLRL
ncbi:MAG: 16S rRNA (cytosine1402-N4)-methyltransferase [Saprospiraceae bacterium]|jgi:16S rRNA (cytosine1402-N4)-methyltransferase